jgi:hypothetical protein
VTPYDAASTDVDDDDDDDVDDDDEDRLLEALSASLAKS